MHAGAVVGIGEHDTGLDVCLHRLANLLQSDIWLGGKAYVGGHACLTVVLLADLSALLSAGTHRMSALLADSRIIVDAAGEVSASK